MLLLLTLELARWHYKEFTSACSNKCDDYAVFQFGLIVFSLIFEETHNEQSSDEMVRDLRAFIFRPMDVGESSSEIFPLNP